MALSCDGNQCAIKHTCLKHQRVKDQSTLRILSSQTKIGGTCPMYEKSPTLEPCDDCGLKAKPIAR